MFCLDSKHKTYRSTKSLNVYSILEMYSAKITVLAYKWDRCGFCSCVAQQKLYIFIFHPSCWTGYIIKTSPEQLLYRVVWNSFEHLFALSNVLSDHEVCWERERAQEMVLFVCMSKQKYNSSFWIRVKPYVFLTLGACKHCSLWKGSACSHTLSTHTHSARLCFRIALRQKARSLQLWSAHSWCDSAERGRQSILCCGSRSLHPAWFMSKVRQAAVLYLTLNGESLK